MARRASAAWRSRSPSPSVTSATSSWPSWRRACRGGRAERGMRSRAPAAFGDVGDKLLAKRAPRVQALKVGPGLDPQSEMGPLVTRQHRDKVMGYVDQGVKEGAKLVVDGRGLKLQGYEQGNFMGGCLFDEVKPEMTIYKDE